MTFGPMSYLERFLLIRVMRENVTASLTFLLSPHLVVIYFVCFFLLVIIKKLPQMKFHLCCSKGNKNSTADNPAVIWLVCGSAAKRGVAPNTVCPPSSNSPSLRSLSRRVCPQRMFAVEQELLRNTRPHQRAN